mgnify:CR=1 FL=1
MGAKIISVSSDDSTYYTLPGNTGDFSDQLGVLDDTIFGQTYKSQQPNLINWMVTANALYKGFAGYMVVIKQAGTPTTMTTEAMSLVSGKTYKTTSTTKNVWDRLTTVTVFDNAVDHTADVLNIDYVFGQVTFKPAYTVTGPVTVTGKYLPMTSLAKYQKFSLTQNMDAINNSDIPTLQGNSGHETFDFGLRTVSLEVSGVYASSNGYRAALVARNEVVIEINPDGGSKSVARGFFRPATRKQTGKVGALEEETANFNLTVPDNSLMLSPFSWQFSSSTDLSVAVQKCLQGFQNNTNVYVKYLPDGSTGLKGSGLITDFSLSGGMDAMNEFSVTIQGTGGVTTV